MRVTRLVPTAALFGLLVSCGSLHPPGYRDVPSISTLLVKRAPVHQTESPGKSFLFATLAFQPTIDKSQPTLYALRGRDHQIVVPPEYTELRCWRSDAALGKHHLSKQWQRIDLDSGERTPLPFAELVRVRSGRRPTDGPTHWVGATRQPDQLWTIILLGEDGQPVNKLTDVVDRSFVEGPQPLDYLPAGGYVVHFEPVGQDAYDRIYNIDGCVISPPLPPLLRMLGDVEHAPVISHAIVLDKARGLCWPVLDDGSIMPKPDDALGLLPLPDADAPQGWAAGWQTADGERWAILPRFRIEGEELLASREQASFSDVVCQARRQRGGEGYTVTRWTWLARDGANGSTMAYEGNGAELEPILALSTSSMSAAAEQVRKLSIAATRTARAESAEMARLAREAEARRVAALEAERQRRRENARLARTEVARLVAAREFAEADAYMWQNCAYTETIVWLANAASGQIDQLSLSTLNIAARSGKNQQLFRSAYRDRVAQLNARSSPGQLGHRGFSGSAASTWQPSKSAPYADVNAQTKTIFDNMRQNSMNNYLSGKQSWYFSSNTSIRR